jgi:hypothetical protein
MSLFFNHDKYVTSEVKMVLWLSCRILEGVEGEGVRVRVRVRVRVSLIIG